MREARLVDTETGLVVQGEGWFVLNARDASWESIPRMGTWLAYQAEGVPQPVATTPSPTRRASSCWRASAC